MESSLAFMDDLLDFSSDIGEEDEEEDAHGKALPFTLNPKEAAGDAFHSDDSCRVKPEFAEEELEWLSNKDAFPSVETFVNIISEQPRAVSKQLSPVSVLDNNTSSSSHSNSSETNKTSNHGSILMTCCGSFKVPGKARSKRRRKHNYSYPQLLLKQSINRIGNGKVTLPPTKTTTGTAVVSSSTIGRKCLHCGAEKTPQWRAGPLGPKTLCNACGVRFKSGRLVPEYRPASSPSFSPDLHSNSHRKVMEMRRQKHLGTVVKSMDKG